MNNGFIKLMNAVKKNSVAMKELRESKQFLPLLSVPRTVAISDLRWIVGFTPISLHTVLAGKITLDPAVKYVFVCHHKSDEGDYDENNPTHNPYQTYLDEQMTIPTPRSVDFSNDIFHRLLSNGLILSLRDKFHPTGEYLTSDDYNKRLAQGNTFREES